MNEARKTSQGWMMDSWVNCVFHSEIKDTSSPLQHVCSARLYRWPLLSPFPLFVSLLCRHLWPRMAPLLQTAPISSSSSALPRPRAARCWDQARRQEWARRGVKVVMAGFTSLLWDDRNCWVSFQSLFSEWEGPGEGCFCVTTFKCTQFVMMRRRNESFYQKPSHHACRRTPSVSEYH